MFCTRCAGLRILSKLSNSESRLRFEYRIQKTLKYSTQNNLAAEHSEVQIGKTIFNKKTGIIRISNYGKRWESVVGLEVHTQVKTNSKLFSSAPTLYNQPVNSKVSFFDAAVPGTLPVLNKRAAIAAIQASLALGAEINLTSFFDRKHYFYADLPAGYQITQHRKPVSQGGRLTFNVRNESLKKNYTKSSELVQIQIEQDSGKSLHDVADGNSLIDLNRCGTGLLELVFSPDLQHGDEAAAAARELTLILQTLGVSRGRMERGEIRVDANISVREVGAPLGTRTEVKNLNSLRSVARAVEFEVWRQISVLEAGGVVDNETRGFEHESRQTVSMRDKERKQDYRFMPEPNLPPLVLDPSTILHLENSLPELPFQTRLRLQDDYGLSEDTSIQLVDRPDQLLLFQSCADLKPNNYKAVANIISLIVQEYLVEHNIKGISAHHHSHPNHLDNGSESSENVWVSPESLVSLSNLREDNVINFTALREVVRLVLGGDIRPPAEIVVQMGLKLITDINYIQEFVEDSLKENAELVEKYIKATDKKRVKLFSRLLVQINQDQRTQKVDMRVFNNILKQNLENKINNAP